MNMHKLGTKSLYNFIIYFEFYHILIITEGKRTVSIYKISHTRKCQKLTVLYMFHAQYIEINIETKQTHYTP